MRAAWHRGFGDRVDGLERFRLIDDVQADAQVLARLKSIQSPLCIFGAITGLALSVVVEPIAPAGPALGRGQRRIEIQSIAMLESHVTFVYVLHARATAHEPPDTDAGCEPVSSTPEDGR